MTYGGGCGRGCGWCDSRFFFGTNRDEAWSTLVDLLVTLEITVVSKSLATVGTPDKIEIFKQS